MKYLFALAVLLAFAASAAAQVKPVAGQGVTSPIFSAPAMDGTKIDSDSLRGKVVVINLWFINCPNCIEEIKVLNQLVTQYSTNKDVVFLGFAASPKADLERFLLKHPFKYQIIPDSIYIILSQFGTPDKNGDLNIPFPMHYVLDREGNVAVKVQGVKGIEAVKKELVHQFPAKANVSK